MWPRFNRLWSGRAKTPRSANRPVPAVPGSLEGDPGSRLCDAPPHDWRLAVAPLPSSSRMLKNALSAPPPFTSRSTPSASERPVAERREPRGSPRKAGVYAKKRGGEGTKIWGVGVRW
jgi:hypothetical protein